MSSLSQATVFKINEILPHPNADRLEIIEFDGRPAIVQKDLHAKGSLAIFVGEDLICPNTEQFAFLGSNRRVKAKKLRGVFSMGIIIPALPHHVEGDDVTEELGITKYEPQVAPVRLGKVDEISAPSGAIHYTDIESLRKYKDVLEIGEEVILTEKTHGSNARYVYQDGRLHLGSHYRWLDPENDNVWKKAASRRELTEKLAAFPNVILCGEVYGQVQKGFPYGVESGSCDFAAFDAFSIEKGRYLNFDDFMEMCRQIDVPTVPILFRGLYRGFDDVKHFAEGSTTFANANHVREGFVIRPVRERWDHKCGRVILKLHGEGYLLAK